MLELREYAERTLAPLAVTYQQANSDAVAMTNLGDYATVKALDVLRRLHASHQGKVAPTAALAPVPRPIAPTTVVAAGQEGYLVLPHGQGASQSVASAAQVLSWFQQHNPLPSAHRSLIVDSPSTLAELIRAAQHSSAPRASALQMDWWGQRADFPGTGATYIATRVARSRWVSGQAPAQEKGIDPWLTWLSIDPTDPAVACRTLVHIASDGPSLPGLHECSRADSLSWTDLRRFTSRRSLRDSRREAALGLTARNQAAEYYASIRLSDPLVAQEALREGTLVEATITAVDRRSITLRSTSPISRFRLEDRVHAWAGNIDQAGSPNAFTGTLSHQSANTDGTLNLSVDDAVAPGSLSVTMAVTLRPNPADPYTHSRLRSRFGSRLRDPRNWVARGMTPPTTRRNVPLDVAVAAAEDSAP